MYFIDTIPAILPNYTIIPNKASFKYVLWLIQFILIIYI